MFRNTIHNQRKVFEIAAMEIEVRPWKLSEAMGALMHHGGDGHSN